MSVYCDWVRKKVGSTTSVSVWQHVKLSRSVPEIHWHVAGTLSNQQTNKLQCSIKTTLRRMLGLIGLVSSTDIHFTCHQFREMLTALKITGES